MTEAGDGEQALKLARVRPIPQALILDLNLPKIDGYEVCRTLKEDESFQLIPVIALTSEDSADEKSRALDVGVDDFLSKPINRAELTVRLRSLLRIHRFNQELIGAESVALALARAVAAKDGYSYSHVEDVAGYAVMLGKAVGLVDAELKLIRYGSILHNVGKIAIPDFRPGKNWLAHAARNGHVSAASADRLRHLRPAEAFETSPADHPAP